MFSMSLGQRLRIQIAQKILALKARLTSSTSSIYPLD